MAGWVDEEQHAGRGGKYKEDVHWMFAPVGLWAAGRREGSNLVATCEKGRCTATSLRSGWFGAFIKIAQRKPASFRNLTRARRGLMREERTLGTDGTLISQAWAR